MSIFTKKKQPEKAEYNVVTDNFIPAVLPSYGYALDTFVTGAYTAESEDDLQKKYEECKEKLGQIIDTCDEECKGDEADQYIDGQNKHLWAMHESEVASHEHQAARINSSRETRKMTLQQQKDEKEKRLAECETEVEPLKGLKSQFKLKIGGKTVSIGLIVTIGAMIIDALVNYSYLQSIILGNGILLGITVFCMSVMSDGSMMALGVFLSHKEEKFTSKTIFNLICISLLVMFALSIIASVMMRFGSMDATYGTLNSKGEFVGKDSSYSIAEYGVTMVTSFVTTATGLLSFAFSLDKNAYKIGIREDLEKEIRILKAELELIQNELSDLEKAPDPLELDKKKREAAEHHIQALNQNLKLHLRKMVTLKIEDPEFTEKMAVSGRKLLDESPVNNTANCTMVKFEKVS